MGSEMCIRDRCWPIVACIIFIVLIVAEREILFLAINITQRSPGHMELVGVNHARFIWYSRVYPNNPISDRTSNSARAGMRRKYIRNLFAIFPTKYRRQQNEKFEIRLKLID